MRGICNTHFFDLFLNIHVIKLYVYTFVYISVCNNASILRLWRFTSTVKRYKKILRHDNSQCKCRPTASNYSRHCPFGYPLFFFPAFGAIYRYVVHRTLGSWSKKYSSQDMTFYFLSFHSSVIFYCFSCRRNIVD